MPSAVSESLVLRARPAPQGASLVAHCSERTLTGAQSRKWRGRWHGRRRPRTGRPGGRGSPGAWGTPALRRSLRSRRARMRARWSLDARGQTTRNLHSHRRTHQKACMRSWQVLWLSYPYGNVRLSPISHLTLQASTDRASQVSQLVSEAHQGSIYATSFIKDVAFPRNGVRLKAAVPASLSGAAPVSR